MPPILVNGFGRYFGDYVIEKIGEIRTFFMPDGAPRKIEFEINLKRFA